MNELIIKCTKISITGWKNINELKLNTMKIQGAGLNILKLMEIVKEINNDITKDIISLDDMMDTIINKHKAIKIIMPNNKEIRMAVNDKQGNLALGVTFLSIQKIEFKNVSDIESKYKF